MRIEVVGLNHRVAPLEVRESLAFPRGQLPAALAALRKRDGVLESIILSTCNRVEVYLCGEAEGKDGLVEEFLSDFHSVKREVFERHLYRYEDGDAVEHLFKVASGLDSMVIGEAQITGQVREAYETAVREHAVNGVLHRLFQQALSAAKRIRTCSGIGAGRASVASVAVDFAERIFETLSRRTVLLIGAGEMGEAALRSLVAAGAETTLVANRTLARAEALAEEYGGLAASFDRLDELLARSDIVICSTSAPHHVVKESDVARALRARAGQPMFLIDISVPRNVAPSAGDLEGCFLYNLDDLQAVVNQTLRQRASELERCIEMAGEESRRFMAWFTGLSAKPTIVELSHRLHELKRRELRALSCRLPDLPEGTQ